MRVRRKGSEAPIEGQDRVQRAQANSTAMSVPCGLSEGLPVGFQIMAPALADDRCYQVAAALEAAQDDARGHRFLDQLSRRTETEESA